MTRLKEAVLTWYVNLSWNKLDAVKDKTFFVQK